MDLSLVKSSDYLSKLISIILGLLLAILFRKACIDHKSMVLRTIVPVSDLAKYHWNVNDVCLKYKMKEIPCS